MDTARLFIWLSVIALCICFAQMSAATVAQKGHTLRNGMFTFHLLATLLSIATLIYVGYLITP